MTKTKNKTNERTWSERLKKNFVTLVKNIPLLLKWLFKYSGSEFIFRKFYPAKNSGELPTGFIWIIGIYVTMFGIAFQRYESRTYKIDNLVNNVIAQIDTGRVSYALTRIPDLQWQSCPLKPEILNPKTVIISLFGGDYQYEDQTEYLKDILISHREKLTSLNLGYCDLRGTIFLGGNFDKSSLIYAKLDKAILGNVSFKGTDFFNAKFNKTWFTNCNFSGATLLGVNFEDTFFHKCNLKEATNITIDQLLKCRSLYESTLKPEWFDVINKKRPELLEWPMGIPTDGLNLLIKRNLPKYMDKIFKEHSSD